MPGKIWRNLQVLKQGHKVLILYRIESLDEQLEDLKGGGKEGTGYGESSICTQAINLTNFLFLVNLKSSEYPWNFLQTSIVWPPFLQYFKKRVFQV